MPVSPLWIWSYSVPIRTREIVACLQINHSHRNFVRIHITTMLISHSTVDWIYARLFGILWQTKKCTAYRTLQRKKKNISIRGRRWCMGMGCSPLNMYEHNGTGNRVCAVSFPSTESQLSEWKSFRFNDEIKCERWTRSNIFHPIANIYMARANTLLLVLDCSTNRNKWVCVCVQFQVKIDDDVQWEWKTTH